eukprot:5247183-Prymnesium_polylepis.1
MAFDVDLARRRAVDAYGGQLCDDAARGTRGACARRQVSGGKQAWDGGLMDGGMAAKWVAGWWVAAG